MKEQQTIPVEISFTDNRGIVDKEFRKKVVDDIYDMIFKNLNLTSLGIQFKDNTETITFNLQKKDEDPITFAFIFEQLSLLKETEPKFDFNMNVPNDWKNLLRDFFQKYPKNNNGKDM